MFVKHLLRFDGIVLGQTLLGVVTGGLVVGLGVVVSRGGALMRGLYTCWQH